MQDVFCGVQRQLGRGLRQQEIALPDVPVCEEFSRLALEGVQGLLKEIANLDIPFRRTEDTRTCDYCDFKAICGR